MRSRGITFSSREMSPERWCSAFASSDQEVVHQRTRPVTITSTMPMAP